MKQEEYLSFDTESKKFWRYLLIFRLFLALNTKTLHHPDESYQSVDIAYDFVYGGVAKSWEWESENALRSTIFPIFYAVYFKFLNLFYLDVCILISYGPNIMNGILWWIADTHFYESIKTIYGVRLAKFSMLIYLISVYPLYVLPRTLSNSFEAMLLMIAVNQYLKISSGGKVWDKHAIILTVIITLSFIVRNTSIVPWLLPMAWKVFKEKTFQKFFVCGVFIAIPIFLFSITLDSLYYGRLV
jgi:hypothetical protein